MYVKILTTKTAAHHEWWYDFDDPFFVISLARVNKNINNTQQKDEMRLQCIQQLWSESLWLQTALLTLVLFAAKKFSQKRNFALCSDQRADEQ